METGPKLKSRHPPSSLLERHPTHGLKQKIPSLGVLNSDAEIRQASLPTIEKSLMGAGMELGSIEPREESYLQ